MNRESLAALLNGREYLSEISKSEEAQAKAAGLLVIFGASDDLMEFRGAFTDEVGAWDGATALVHAAGVMPSWESFDDKSDEAMARSYFALKQFAKTVDALWCAEDGYSWTFKTDVPHSTFEIVEDGDRYCRGIVIHVSDLAARGV